MSWKGVRSPINIFTQNVKPEFNHKQALIKPKWKDFLQSDRLIFLKSVKVLKDKDEYIV